MDKQILLLSNFLYGFHGEQLISSVLPEVDPYDTILQN